MPDNLCPRREAKQITCLLAPLAIVDDVTE
jgi:hypothetical protein